MIINVSWSKAFRDLLENKARTFLVILALIVGIVAVGSIAVAYSILIREMDKNYLKTDPASATLWIEPIDGELVKTVTEMPQIAKAEARAEIIGRFQTAPGEWCELWLYVIPNFNNIKIDKFTPDKGAWPPATGEILLERTAVKVAKAELGDKVVIKLPDRKEQTLSFTGTVHTPGLPPAWVEGRVYGYITPETLALFGGSMTLGQLKITVAEHELDKSYIRKTAYELKGWLEENGRTVSRIDIPEPGKHIHADLMAAFISMLGVMGLFALIMSGILVTNIISGMLGRQIRQIGVMKAIGGNTGQIGRIYLIMVLLLGLIALTVGMPVSLALGRMLANYEAVQMLNFEIFDNRTDLWVYILVVATGLLIPLLAAAQPIYKGSKITILAALGDYGAGGKAKFGSSRLDVWLGNIKGGARTFILSLRNVFRRRGRLILTLLTLIVAGASFMTAMNVAASIDQGVASKFDATPYDIEIAFSRTYPQDEIEKVIKGIDGVKSVETWGGSQSFTVLPDGTLGKQLSLTAPLINTTLSPKPPIIKGRWLRAEDRNTIVMNDALLKNLDIDAKIGDKILLDINNQRTYWQLVGISREFLTSNAYVSYGSFMQATEHISGATNVVVKIADWKSADKVARDMEIELGNAGFDVYTMWKTADARKVMEAHMLLIIGILMVMATLFVIVGGLGLASTMSLNVLDRTRELGVVRAIGASTRDVLQIIIFEGVFIGAISWVFAAVLSFPLAMMIGQVLGAFLNAPMNIITSAGGWIIWFFVILAISSVSSAVPAWSAAKQPVNEVLSYE